MRALSEYLGGHGTNLDFIPNVKGSHLSLGVE